jgi:hypothetical protein
MDQSDKGTIRGASGGGVAGNHGPAEHPELLVGPTTTDEFNTAQLRLIPVGCFRVDDVRFDFDSSFVTSDPANEENDIRAELKLLVDLLQEHPESPLSVFGHADPVGSDDYNKQLSGRRATVIYALLISNTDSDTAVGLWQAVARHEKWGVDQRQTMETVTGLPVGSTDKVLFKAYMQKLCPPELKLGKKDFLGQGADAKGKGDFQGCSEFNPVLIFSEQKNKDFKSQKDKTTRNDANAINRRVLVLLFQKGSKINPAKWPCPRATEGVSDCLKRFFSDGNERRNTRLPDKDRQFDDTKDTFACRFYQRLLTNSPCETALPILRVRLFDRQAQPLPFAPCLVTEPGKNPKPDRASGAPPNQPAGPNPPGSGPSPAPKAGAGASNKQNAFITIRELAIPATVNVKWSRPKSGDGPNTPLPKPTDQFEFEMDVVVDVPEDEDKAGATRLKNLGYVQGPRPVDNILAFQIDYKPRFGSMQINGKLDAATKEALKTVHDACDTVIKGPRSTPV